MINIFVFSFIIFLIGFLGSYPAFISNNTSCKLNIFEFFSKGAFLGLAFMHFLPESIEHAELAQVDVKLVMFLIAACCYMLQFFEKFIENHRAVSSCEKIHWCHVLVFLILMSHAIIEGGAIGIASDFKHMFLISLGVGAHKASVCFALATSLLAFKIRLNFVKLLVGLFVLATPLSIISFSLLKFSSIDFFGNGFIFIINSIAAGTFLYCAIGDHLVYDSGKCNSCKFQNLVWFGCGFALISVLAFV